MTQDVTPILIVLLIFGSLVAVVSYYILDRSRTFRERPFMRSIRGSLARIIREFERQQKPLLLQTCCQDNVWVTKEASECLKIAQHSVCCSQELFASP
jgi:hypothetical protein